MRHIYDLPMYEYRFVIYENMQRIRYAAYLHSVFIGKIAIQIYICYREIAFINEKRNMKQ